MANATQDIDTLIALCKQGSRNAQFEVYNRYYKPLFNTALRIVKDSHWAEDVMQEAFLKAFTKLDMFKGEVTFGAWLKKIVLNHSIDQYKKQNRNDMDAIDTVLYKTEDDNYKQEAVIDFQQVKAQQALAAIQSLRESYRVVLTLLYIEGYDQEEISEILGITAGNCRTTISRAKDALLKKLSEA
ncbi:RNA polymerase subunit sigma [Flavobacterium akiainvivens]|uniref:RNA polymerase subunit sigma n=1 Tax=Flavobacterium akiainvivens TaxID=1202724 RepID=A0A0M8MGX1_9FLAO|nr:RNA polymerase sigma factor [Flavobacterium akiainvivens]KOS05537.1 RNA polymerase subunit sigma [Flavobacterium akiainvivens]SFQ33843.1 RNA polymerase sigma-70 factor, ECF subfamily [Flavobacterium akiainvivens]